MRRDGGGIGCRMLILGIGSGDDGLWMGENGHDESRGDIILRAQNLDSVSQFSVRR